MDEQSNAGRRTERNPGRCRGDHNGASVSGDRRVADLITRLDAARRAHGHQMDLGTADLRILWMFSDDRARTLKEIAEELRLEQSTVNRQINAALNAGLLRRDRRAGSAAHEFSASAEGERAFEADVEKSMAAYHLGLEALGTDIDEFLAGFSRFVEAYGQAVRPVPSGETEEPDADRTQ